MKGDMMQIGPNKLMYCIKVEDIFGLFHKKSDNLQRRLDESDEDHPTRLLLAAQLDVVKEMYYELEELPHEEVEI